MNVKISLITVTCNAENTLQKCINSVISQKYKNIEYIIIDGNSSDRTMEIIYSNKKHIHFFKSETDEGIYDAMNKGIIMATGDVIGMLNADDYFSNNNVLADIAEAFVQNNVDLLYADLDYVNDQGMVIRKWRSGNYFYKKFNWGWMPPHPTFYAKRKLFENFGLYSVNYGTAADYELMLRFMYLKKVNVFYLNKVIVKMKAGGVSNQNFKNRLKAWKNDFKAINNHQVNTPVFGIIMKPLRKIFQFFP